MYRVLWICRNCQLTWWTEGKSLIEMMHAAEKKGCPRQCSGVSNQIYISEYESTDTELSYHAPGETSPL